MAAFFILSGYTFHRKTVFKEFLLSRIKSLILPYFFFCLLGGGMHLLAGEYEFLNREMVSSVFVSTQPDWLFCGAGWFLIALFWANLMMYAWVKYIDPLPSAVKGAFILSVYLLASCILSLIPAFNQTILHIGITRFPCKMDSGLMALFFMIIGFYLKKTKLFEMIEKNRKPYFFIILVAYLLVVFSNGWMNIANCTYGNIWLFPIEAIGGSLLIYILSSYLARFTRIKNVLMKIGVISLPMFMIHGYFLHLMDTVLSIHVSKSVPDGQAYGYALILFIMIVPLGVLYRYGEKKLYHYI